MNKEVFYNISKIIERDSKSSTYKFALLRGVIDIILDNSPFIQPNEFHVQIPMGLMVEKWMLYYYPILESEILIPQINGNANLAFSKQFEEIIQYYKLRGGFSSFYNDLKSKGIPEEVQDKFEKLVKKLVETISKMPMYYLGRSLSQEYYSIFKVEQSRLRNYKCNDLESLIHGLGTFSIPVEYFEAFKILGSFINGQDSLLFKWAEFSVNASGRRISMSHVLQDVLKGPITERNISESKRIHKNSLSHVGSVYCVWTGKRISSYEIDHLIPFSIWKNNDLWNLLPSDAKINKQKRDKIPSPELIEKQRNLILDYWEIIHENQSIRFQKEMQVSLLGNQAFSEWHLTGITQLQKCCDHLIENRGFEAWNGKLV
ncbi:HNH endonuclease domain-containing protein [Aquirufa ecclesiirivi]